jgi:hypothetical protein
MRYFVKERQKGTRLPSVEDSKIQAQSELELLNVTEMPVTSGVNVTLQDIMWVHARALFYCVRQ